MGRDQIVDKEAGVARRCFRIARPGSADGTLARQGAHGPVLQSDRSGQGVGRDGTAPSRHARPRHIRRI